MCDTIVIVRPDRVWFAKNSDRDPNEAQCLDWHPAQKHPAGARLRCTHIDIPQVDNTSLVLLSRPYWMWGAEMGANEHGVCIGNEAVFTKQPYHSTGLTGMDLVRLGLERSNSAKNALDVIIQLLETHGQGGGCGLEHSHFTYHNSFLIADPGEAWVLETAGNLWAKERITTVRSISNGLTISGFAEKHTDHLRSRVANCRIRQQRTMHLGSQAGDFHELMNLLRDHGPGGLRYSLLNGALSGPCAHAGGMLAATQTTASWVAELKPSAMQYWVTATSTPCLSLFKPVSIQIPVDLGPWPSETYHEQSIWWLHERRVRRMLYATPEFTAERDALENEWLHEQPTPGQAFLLAERWLENHQYETQDTRPWYVRRYWQRRNQWAGVK